MTVTMPTPPLDQAVRDRLLAELDSTFFVEAGAGTGKTRELVRRIVALVASGRVRMAGLAAITFTEAAAAELRDRVRQELERGAEDDARPEDERVRCEAAAGEVDLAAITTIHAFAGGLLRAYPLAAGLPPGFNLWDQVQRDLAFEERFQAWLYDEVPAPAADGRETPLSAAVRRALAAGLKPDDIRALASHLENYADLLHHAMRWEPEGDPFQRAAGIVDALAALEQYVALARYGESDVLVQELRRGQALAAPLADTRTLEALIEALQRYATKGPKLNAGRQGDWLKLADGSSPVPHIKATFKALREQTQGALDWAGQGVLGQLLEHLRDFVLACAAERKHMGVATFHDLLTWARDLLRDHPAIRRRAATTFERIFVDEFQDTDPLQAEIAWFLAGDPAQVAEKDWRKLHLVPGKLFLVGDPKQSIYRFRRADIGMYQLIYEELSEVAWRVSLTQNFRSVAPMIEWVNHQLARDMAEEPGIQAPYRALSAHPRAPEVALAVDECGVYHLGGASEGVDANTLAWQEAVAVAQAARQVRGTLRVMDGKTLRPARYADICVLLRARTHVRKLERAFAQEGVPYRMESGSLVLDTPEVRDVLACLRAVDDPTDQVALVGALRSLAYGCSDADLLAWVEAGGSLNYLDQPAEGQEAPGCDGPVRAAFESLRAFHAVRLDRSAAETVERFIRERLLTVGTFGQERPREGWRRLRYLVAQARTLGSDGRVTLRGVLDWLEILRARAEYDAESPVPEGDEDAVRLMTVHGSKGLEFPVVILTGLGRGDAPAPRDADIVADYRCGQLAARCGQLRTAGYDAEREKRIQAAEAVRLLYVAATRARDHLVLCLFHKASAECHATRIVAGLGQREGMSRRWDGQPGEDEGRRTKDEGAADDGALTTEQGPEEHRRREEGWMAARRERVLAHGRERRRTPSGLGQRAAAVAERYGTPAYVAVDPEEGARVEESDESGAVPRLPMDGDVARRIGSAVHAALQHVDLETLGDLEAVAANQAERYGVTDRVDDVTGLARTAASSGAVRKAVATGRFWREVPLGTAVGEVVLEGVADLVYENLDGTVGIVEYKTDDLDGTAAEHRAAGYGAEGGAYVLALEQATGKRVSSVAFVFANSSGATVIYQDRQVDQLLFAASRALGKPLPARPAPVVGLTGTGGGAASNVDLDLFDPAWHALVTDWAGRLGLFVEPGADVMDGGRVVGQTVAIVRTAKGTEAAVSVVDGSAAAASAVCVALQAQGHTAISALPDETAGEALVAALGIGPS
jgi:ATP-dependent helicase/nuclease subunit A